MCRLLFDIQRPTLRIEIHHAVALRITDAIGKYRAAGLASRRSAKLVRQAMTEVDVISQRQGYTLGTHERTADGEGLRESFGARLLRVRDRDTPLTAVAQQALIQRQVLRRRDQQKVANTRHHQSSERVVHHRLVIDRQELLADAASNRVQPGAGAAGQNDPLQRHWP